MSDDNTQDGAEPSPASAGSLGMGVPLLLDAIGDCLAQVDPFDQRCVVVLNTPERRKAHMALFRLKQMFSDDAEVLRKLKPEVSILRGLEWSASYSRCTGWPCCPVCGGIKPGHGADEQGYLPNNQGHRDGCKLAAAIHP